MIFRILSPVLLALAMASSCSAQAPRDARPAAERAEGAPGGPSVERLASLPRLDGTAPAEPRWSADGKSLAFLWNEGGWPFRDVWVVRALDGKPRRLTDLAGESPERARGVTSKRQNGTTMAALTADLEARERGGVSDLVWDAEGEAVYFAFQGDLHRVPASGGDVERITRDGAGKSLLARSPDGRRISWVQGGDLHLYDTQRGHVVRATRIGVRSINTVPIGRYAGPDATIASYAWSPDNTRILFSHVDLTKVRRVPFPSYLHEEPILNEVRRSYPGDTDELRRAGVYHLADGLVRFIDTPEPTDRSILDLDWSPDGSQILIHSDSDSGEHRFIYVADAETLSLRHVHRDHRPRRIYSLFEAAWSADGREIYFINDADKHYRLYAVPAAGGAPRALTPDEYDVTSDLSVSAKTGAVRFVSTEESPYERHVYLLDPKTGAVSQVTELPGVHAPVYAPDGQGVALISSNDVTPPELYLDTIGASAEERRVTRSPIPEFYNYTWVAPRYTTFKSAEGDFTLHARIIEPPNIDRAKSYPAIIGNIYSNTVRNQWVSFRPISLLQQHQVLSKDYVVAQIDLRGSVGYGVAFREAFQGDWGGGDLTDLTRMAEHLQSLPYVDPDRIGIWGNSYGGMMTLFGLFERPGLFAAGVAGAPAVEPTKFLGGDQHLSRRPQTHPEIFQDSSLLLSGENLEDPLLILHSFHDDVVPLQTSIMMAEKLMLLGKDFEMEIVSNTGHWWAGREHYAVHTLRRLQDFLDEHVGEGAEPQN